MIDGKMIPLGICTNNKTVVPRSPKFSDNTSTGDFWGKCVKKKGA